ncbi:MAG TPA: carboxypeptidase regulatory-like domain-containing protein [Acidobacteriaceae bacterium]
MTDPTGAVIPHASVSVTTPDGHTVTTATSDSAGVYQAGNLAPGTYIVIGNAQGFAASASKAVTLGAGENHQFNVTLPIADVKQQVQVESEPVSVDTSPDNNANAIVIKGKDLEALSDDPDELQSELQALAGPAAGPNGGQIYIDGFTGGQLPPKASIREIRINQNPFSAQFDRLGYGRIEILTKPGTDKLHGQIESRGNTSAFNSQNPILNSNLRPGQTPLEEPGYYSYNVNGSVGGPITKSSSFFFSVFSRNNQNESVVDALNPLDTSQTLNEAISNPSSRLEISPRFDFQLGKSNTLTIRGEFHRAVNTNTGISALSLPSQATNSHDLENTLQVSDSIVLSPYLVNDIRFQYRRVRSQTLPLSSAPAVTLQGAFTTGGANAGTTEDHQDDYELQDYFSQSLRAHSLNYGARLRAYRDVNYSNNGANSAYVFDTAANYLAGKPTQYTVTLINNYVARAILFDAALFFQDDWKVNPRFTFSYGVRWETQNRIRDKSDWAPRVVFAYGLDGRGNQKPKTVLRAGYGWFYQRFTVPNGTGGTPYLVQAIHNNFVPLGSTQVPNERGFTVGNPNFYNPNQAVTNFAGSSDVAPTGYSIDPHFRAANDMQAAIGIDRQLSRVMTGNVTYLYSRGVHMYLTNNVSAAGIFPEQNILSGTYPTTPIAQPAENNMQFQSGGVYRQSQVIASVTARYSRFSITSFYTYNEARGDTNGVASTPTFASRPGFDYGRAGFDIHNRFLITGNITAPWQLSFSPFLSFNTGAPYDITTGKDLTGNNQFNSRPTFAASCGEANVVVTAYGCLDANPLASSTGASEMIVPHNLGTGPNNVSMNLRVSKVFGIGPVVEGGGNRGGGGGGGMRGGGGGRGGGGMGRGLSGNQGGFGKQNAATQHKYNLTIDAYSQNIFNHENLGAPNGTISSPFFGKSQSLAGGFFGPSTAGNRSVFLSATFNF